MAMKYFAHENVRKEQDQFITDSLNSLSEKKTILIHAPTGIGKTAASLATALSVAIKENKTVFFLTNRHSQHDIVIDTVKAVEKKTNERIGVLDLIGRKHMCAVPGIESLMSTDFNEMCFQLRKNNRCQYYTKVFDKEQKLKKEGQEIVKELRSQTRSVNETIIHLKTQGACPYFTSLEAGKKARIIIADYYHFFNPLIRKSVLTKVEKTIENIILIIDEAHNLPGRLRDLQSAKTDNRIIAMTVREVKDHNTKLGETLQDINKDLSDELRKITQNERVVTKQFLTNIIKKHSKIEELVEELKKVSEKVYETENKSYSNAFGEFLKKWEETSSEGSVRIVKNEIFNNTPLKTLNLHGLDPSKVGKTINQVYATILMSGTLKPLEMYENLLGVTCIKKEYKSPFPKTNRKLLVFPKTTTQYSKRGTAQYNQMSQEIITMLQGIQKNTIIFFPSYALRNEIYERIKHEVRQTIFKDESKLTKEEKEHLISRFKSYSTASGAILMSVIGGNYSEGVDFPGAELELVIIVGVPLQPPDLLTKSLINYYEGRFGQGWFYAYTYPAMRKVMQATGRVIRSDTDRGIIVLMDERYSWNNYYKALPSEAIITLNPKNELNKFYTTN